MSVSCALPFDERIVLENKRTLIPVESYQKVHKNSVANYKEFWAGIASELDWFKRWERVLDDSNPPFYKWFPGAQLNASYLCLDRHVRSWRKNKVAIIWEGEPTENGAPTHIRKLTYQDVYRDVNRIAHVLREKYGIRKGDMIGFYLPMIPEFPVFMLAAARLGACFTVIFSGFSADSLADRLADADAKLLVTADGGRRRGNLVKLKELADRAAENVAATEDDVAVLQVVLAEGGPVGHFLGVKRGAQLAACAGLVRLRTPRVVVAPFRRNGGQRPGRQADPRGKSMILVDI